MYKIFIPIDPSEYTNTAFKYAFEIASHKEVSIEGVAIIDDMSIAEMETTLVPLPEGSEDRIKEEQKLLDNAKEKANEELNKYKKLCDEKGISYTGKLMLGRPDFIIEEAGKYSDFIIIGMRNYFHFETEKTPYKTVNKIIKHLHTPVLTVPEKFKSVKNVVVAYDGSYPALKAAREFAKLSLNKEYEITIIISDKNESNGTDLLSQIEDYLTEHVNAKINKVHTTKNIIKYFDEHFSENTDLVVCGMHSQKILKKVLVGSFPKHLIKMNKITSLIAQ